MTKKKRSKFSLPFLKSSWISALLAGVAIGVASQHVPELRTYTEKLASRLNKPLEQALSFDHLQDVILKKNAGIDKPISQFQIERSGYSLAYDARNRNPAWVSMSI